jgi:hypothetical protein
MSEKQVREVYILVNEKKVGPFNTDLVSGLQIKEKASLAQNTDLFRKEGEKLTPVSNSELVKIHENEQFVDFPPTPVS